MRVEVFDRGGDRYVITVEGQVTREKAYRVFDLIELLGGIPNSSLRNSSAELSKIDRVRSIVERYFPLVWFSSKDVQFTYERELGESIKLSTVSTYLSRLVDRGFLMVEGGPNAKRYRMITEIARSALHLMK